MKTGDLITINTKGYHKYDGCIAEIVREMDFGFFLVRLNDDICFEIYRSEMVKHDR
jgi:hypothetical protein